MDGPATLPEPRGGIRDPEAFRCGVNDYADGLVNDSITEEINGNHYDYRDAESIVEEVEAEEEELENA
jgi:hypothetical protein